MGKVERYPNGTFCWVDLGTTDAPGAKAFYGGLLGWSAEDVPGTVLLPPMDIPVGRFTIVADPAGAVFSAAAAPGGAFRGVDGS
jgi:predicted enzyme related to lactoylglutathione lyase